MSEATNHRDQVLDMLVDSIVGRIMYDKRGRAYSDVGEPLYSLDGHQYTRTDVNELALHAKQYYRTHHESPA